ncbi:hypothetical protein C8Q80DRAFT_1095507 [Daedaleopsis nitida]|nr:hypothetical protein C8Q80DRAFT_1095507 [Daedaleopsis nitida]
MSPELVHWTVPNWESGRVWAEAAALEYHASHHEHTFPTLPTELLDDIFTHVWLSYPWGGHNNRAQWGERWKFFDSVAVVSDEWYETIASVALRHITIQCANDLERYRRISVRRFGLDENCRDGGGERVHPDARSVLQGTTLRVVLTDVECCGFEWNTDYKSIPHYIPACKSIEIIVQDIPSSKYKRPAPYGPVFELLEQYDTASSLRMEWKENWWIKSYVLPKVYTHGITHLRLANIPRCVCPGSRRFRTNGLIPSRPKHYDTCFFYLPERFPDLRHLHIETPVPLQRLKMPGSLRLLTIEAPPAYYNLEMGENYSTLVFWNIPAAVNTWMFADNASEGPKKIVVNTGKRKPHYWDMALDSCRRHGIELQRRYVYEQE